MSPEREEAEGSYPRAPCTETRVGEQVELADSSVLYQRCQRQHRVRTVISSPFSGVISVHEGAFFPRRGLVIYTTVFTEPLSRPPASSPEGLALTTALPGLPWRHNGVGTCGRHPTVVSVKGPR